MRRFDPGPPSNLPNKADNFRGSTTFVELCLSALDHGLIVAADAPPPITVRSLAYFQSVIRKYSKQKLEKSTSNTWQRLSIRSQSIYI